LQESDCLDVRCKPTEEVRLYTAGMSPDPDLMPHLKQYWGYSSFRPMQENIVRSLMGGHDTCVIMPTGGGKSLCYQFPALIMGRTAIVISPLIALMHDQAAQLAQMGIPAAFLNSSMPADEQSVVVRKARAGEYRLLYLSPERLARQDSVGWLKQVPIAFFAIDEAHCISEWGHEFRPDYRQLSRLRANFPDCPIAAFTASATRQVRHDILHQLQLKNPHKYIASFHRSNLRYVVRECDAVSQPRLLLAALGEHTESNVIVYAPTIVKVEATVDFLQEKGIPAVAYHGQMDAALRKTNQERWMSDEVRVLVGTIAFGLGINKAAVRAVIHLSLPKSVEQYYQEAGRAGRDGLPADCVLLWQKRDAGLLAHFIDQVIDAAEKERSWQRYHAIRRFVDSRECRHRQICVHFGEIPKWQTCSACDVCTGMPEWLTESTVAGRKRTGESAAGGRRAAGAPAAAPANPELWEYLREWRREIAKQANIAAFVVLHDSSLEEVCRLRPRSLAALRQVSGIGERKAELYGQSILDALARFDRGVRAAAPLQPKTKPAEETIQLLGDGQNFAEIARTRGRQLKSVIDLVASLVEKGTLEFQDSWVDPEKRASIEAACTQLGVERLKPIKEALPPEITFEEIRLVVANLRRKSA